MSMCIVRIGPDALFGGGTALGGPFRVEATERFAVDAPRSLGIKD
jgi:hypothetical protein